MSSTGHEDEFRQLFAQEASERLGALASQLVALEESGNNAELIDSIFREAHTLKGAAAVVGMQEIGVVAHAMEDLLEQLRRGDRAPTPTLIDALLAAVDGLSSMLPSVLAGDDRTALAADLEQSLRQVADATSSPATVESEAVEAEAHTVASAPSRAVPTGDTETARVPVARLDEIIRLVGESAAANLRVGRMVGARLAVDPGTVDELRELSLVLNALQERAMRARMVPVATITDVLQRAVRDVARITGKDVRWEVRGDDTELDRGVLQQLADPLLHLVRNAVDHGIDAPNERAAAGKPAQATVRLHAMQLGSEVIMTVTDDGAGIDVAAVRRQAERRGSDTSSMSDEEALYLVFRSGLSTAEFVSDISGRGVGLDVVRANVEAVRGRVEIHTDVGVGTEFRVIVPITLAVLPCLLVSAGGHKHALPMHSVVVTQEGGLEVRSEGRPQVWVDDQAVPLNDLATTLGLPEGLDTGPIIVVAGLTRRHAFRVDALVGQRDVVVKGLSRLLPRLEVLAGASVEPDGSILLVLDVTGLIDRARMSRSPLQNRAVIEADSTAATPRRGTLLVVDDALTVRELQRSILERAGYEVITASDGIDALGVLAETQADLVLTDVEMPRMNGFALTAAIRALPTRGNVPILILTSLASAEDRQRGLEAGADGYIVKSSFDESSLLQAVERLLGR